MSTEQTPTTNTSDVEIIKRRDIVTFAVVAYVQLTITPLMVIAGRSTINKVTSDSSQPNHQQDSSDPEWKWWKNSFDIAYLKFDDVSWSNIHQRDQGIG
jgi:hypothetical protein